MKLWIIAKITKKKNSSLKDRVKTKNKKPLSRVLKILNLPTKL